MTPPPTTTRQRLSSFLLPALVWLGLSIIPAFALPGDLDTSFGDAGIVNTAIGSGDETATGVAAQPDGRIVVAGTSYNGSNKDYALVRYNPDGTLDTTFNGTGTATADFRGFDDVCNGVVLQDDGKIVVVGYSSDGIRNDFALARYNPDGTLDTGFGETGTGKVVTTGVALASNSEAYGVALQADGKLVVVGRVALGLWVSAVVRYNADGTIDNSFGSGGVVRFTFGRSDGSIARAAALQGDGRIVVTGQEEIYWAGPYVYTMRLSADGSQLDSSFNGGGIVSESGFGGNAVVIQADGKILTGDNGFRLMRLNGDGSYDTSFGGTGKVDTGIGVGTNIAKGVVLQGDGRIVAAGYSYNGNTGFNDLAVVRYNTNGTPDTGFHQTGKETVHIGSGDAYGQSVALHYDGKILVAGSSLVGGKSQFTLVRFHALENLAVTAPVNGCFVKDGRPVIGGPAAAEATVNVYLDGAKAGSTVASAAGVWSFTPTEVLADGPHAVGVIETDAEGNTVATSNTTIFTVDSMAPEAPLVLTPVNGAFINNTRPYISGTSEAYARLTIYLDEVPCGTVTANGSGAWGFVPASALVDGPHTLKVIAADRAGNIGEFSSIIAFRSSNTTAGTPGDLDTVFGNGGVVTTAIGGGDDTATGVVAQIDGRIVVAGTSYSGSSKDFALVRYNADGTLDTTFNGTGMATADFRGYDDVCNGVVLQDDGKIVVVGYSSNGSRNDFALARYNSDGTLDTGFGETGTGKVVTTGVALASNSEAYGVALQADGKLVVVGRVALGLWVSAVVRYNVDGTIDNSFGSGGVVRFTYGRSDGSIARAAALQGDGRIVVTGQEEIYWVGPCVYTMRLSADGRQLDSSFSGGFVSENGFGGNAVAVQADGKILAGDNGFRLMRLNGDGSYDTGFGGTGKVDTGIGVGSNVAKGVVLQGDGRIVAAGYSYNGNTGFNDFAVVRYNTNGTPDTGFHQTGKETTHIGSGNAYGESVALQTDGRILVAGRSLVGSKYKFSVARYHAFGNLAVTSPANSGFSNSKWPVISGTGDAGATVNVRIGDALAGSTVASAGGIWTLTAANALSDGSYTVIATETNSDGNTLATSNTINFTVDTEAPAAPVVSSPAGGVLVNNTWLQVGGTAEANATVAIYLDEVQAGTVTANGSGVWGFVPESPLVDGLHAVKVAATDQAGNTGAFSVSSTFRSSSIGSGTPGNPDNAFGVGGVVTTAFGNGDDMATGVAVQPDGRIVVAGTSYNGSNNDFALARYNPDGTLDTTFGGTGMVTADFRGFGDVCNSVVLQDDGKIVVVGHSSNGSRNDFALARYNPDGTLDTGFGETGTGKVVTTGVALASNSEAYGVALQADGKLVVVGRVALGLWVSAVVRYNADGTIDNSFGSGGVVRFTYGRSDGSIARAAALQGDGRIVVTGQEEIYWVGPCVYTMRLSADGSQLDSSFSGGFVSESGFGGNAVAVQADGRILAGDNGFRLMRLNGDGSYDTGFGGTGKVDTGIGVGSNIAKGVVLQGDGRIVAAGYSYNGNTGFNDFALVRFNPDGTPDTGFHRTGKVTTHIGSGDAYGQSVALQVDGRILVAGRSLVDGRSRFTVVRYYGTPQPPIVQIGAATVVTKTSATLNGTVNPNSLETTTYFEYGLDASYGTVTSDQACGYGLNAVSKSANIRDLLPNTIYHYRLVAHNSAALFGGITYGKDATFLTEPDPPVDVTAAAIGVSSAGATLAAVVFPNGRETDVHFEYGLTTTYDNATPVQIIPAGTGAVYVFATITGLVPGGTYHFRVVATNSGTPIAVPGLDQDFLAKDPPPTVQTGGATLLTTTSAQVNGTVRAHNTTSHVFFDVGTDGVNFPNSVAATPATVTGDVDTPVTADLTNLAQATTYYYRVRAENGGGSSTGLHASFALNRLSGLTQAFPGTPPDAEGYIFVTLFPPDIVSGWRFVGEQQWRASGVAAGNLATADRMIEFRPVPGYIQPPQEIVTVTSGGATTFVQREYYLSAVTGNGSLSVTLKPESLALPELPVEQRAQWRFSGEDDTQWRDSGTTAGNLMPGTYLIESKPLAGRTTPPLASVLVAKNLTTTRTLTYFLADPPVGIAPLVMAFETVTGSQTLPYAYAGQIRSSAGLSSGFVVKSRVVATAGHVVFDDGTLSAVSGLQWLFQRDRASYEPKPLEPRGYYLFTSYSAQRAAENTPGTSSPASQELDVAALYFNETAGRGGFSGFLASDALDNEFLLSGADKTLVGYPVDGIAETYQGRMHATPPADIAFAHGSSAHTYLTTGIRSSGGTSGGPLCVRFDGGNYYPAAIYLGGTGQTVVRAIDSQVIDLFTRAEVSGNGGANNTGGGISQSNFIGAPDPGVPGSLQVFMEPSAASAAGARWQILTNGDTVLRQSGWSRASLTAGSYLLRFSSVPGFQIPADQTVEITGGQTAQITFTYAANIAPPVITSVPWVDGQSGQPLHYQIVATQAPVSYSLTGSLPAGLGFSTTTGLFNGMLGEAGVFIVTLGATNAGGTGTMVMAISSKPSVPNQGCVAAMGEALAWQIASSESGAGVSYGVYGLPPGLAADASSGLVSGIPLTPGVFPCLVTVAKRGANASAILMFTVNASPLALWRQANFGSPSNTGAAADAADPDHDGQLNLSEYAAGTNPNNAADVFKVLTASKDATSYTVTVAGKASRSYVLERYNSLASGLWTAVRSDGPLAADGPVALRDSAPPPKSAFYRIRVVAP